MAVTDCSDSQLVANSTSSRGLIGCVPEPCKICIVFEILSISPDSKITSGYSEFYTKTKKKLV